MTTLNPAPHAPQETETLSVPLDPQTLRRIDAWAARQPAPKLSRADAVARLVELALAEQGVGADAISVEQLNASNDE